MRGDPEEQRRAEVGESVGRAGARAYHERPRLRVGNVGRATCLPGGFGVAGGDASPHFSHSSAKWQQRVGAVILKFSVLSSQCSVARRLTASTTED